MNKIYKSLKYVRSVKNPDFIKYSPLGTLQIVDQRGIVDVEEHFFALENLNMRNQYII